jgi:excisionase family DNA binding protein
MPTPPIDLSLLLSPEEAAKELRTSVDSIRRRIWSGELPHYRLGRGRCAPIRISLEDLRLYVAEHYIKATENQPTKKATPKSKHGKTT